MFLSFFSGRERKVINESHIAQISLAYKVFTYEDDNKTPLDKTEARYAIRLTLACGKEVIVSEYKQESYALTDFKNLLNKINVWL